MTLTSQIKVVVRVTFQTIVAYISAILGQDLDHNDEIVAKLLYLSYKINDVYQTFTEIKA